MNDISIELHRFSLGASVITTDVSGRSRSGISSIISGGSNGHCGHISGDGSSSSCRYVVIVISVVTAAED